MRLLLASIRLIAALLVTGFTMSQARSQTGYRLLHNFGATSSDGINPYAGVSVDSAGKVYGASYSGGAHALGMVWEIDTAGNYHDLHDFDGVDGAKPSAGVTFDSVGNLYGTCGASPSGYGNVWEIDAAGNYHDLHDFDPFTDGPGEDPMAGVTIDSAGNLYGTCTDGGLYSAGMIWELDTSGNYHDLHDFGAGTDGTDPKAGVTVDSAGKLHGTCYSGGADSLGMVWEIDESGKYHDLHDFGADTGGGANPIAGVTIDSAGNLYGTCVFGSANSESGNGMVWQIDTSSNYHDLHDFFSANPEGANPWAGVTIDSAGNLYGTCTNGGTGGGGIVWEIDKAGSYRHLHDFVDGTLADGANPFAGVTIDAAGNLSGTCESGGSADGGVVWNIYFGGPVLSSFSTAPSALGGSALAGSVSLAGAATPMDTGTVQITSDNSAIPSTSIVVPGGATGTSFALQCGAVTSQSAIHLTASKGGVSKTSTVVLYPGLASFALSPASIFPGEPCNGTLTLNLPAPAGGWLVHLSSNDKKVGVPSSVTVPEGQSAVSFPVTVPSASLGETAQISAKDVDVTLSQNLNITALYTSAISVSPSIISAGNTATGTVTLNTAAPSGFTVNLASQYPSYVGVPATLTIPANASSATFQITTKAALVARPMRC